MKTTKKLSDQKTLSILFLFLFALPAGVLLASDFNFSWVGEWRGTGNYEDIYVNHDYVYCAASSAGVDVIRLGPQFNTAKWVGSFQTSDIAIRFPHYNNSQGAGGYFHLDTTQWENGIHTISWSVADDAGNVEGIGSRYFTIQNTAASTSNRRQIQALSEIPMALHHPIRVLKGYSAEEKTQDIHPREDGTTYLEVRELERIEIQLYHCLMEKRTSGTRYKGYLLQGKRLFSLPAGSFLDDEGGIFYWQLGPGFLGEYLLVFVATTPRGNQTQQHVRINVIPRSTGN